MWTDAKSRELIATEYPWFLTTFDNYSQPIQRADAIRYFVLAHFGGIYLDLDDVNPPPFLNVFISKTDLISHRVVTAVSILCYHIRLGCGALHPLASLTTPWAPYPPIPSSSS